MQVWLPGEDNKGCKWCFKTTALCGPWSFLLWLLTTAERHNNLTEIYALLSAILHLTMAIYMTARWSSMYHTSNTAAAHIGAYYVHRCVIDVAKRPDISCCLTCVVTAAWHLLFFDVQLAPPVCHSPGHVSRLKAVQRSIKAAANRCSNTRVYLGSRV